MKTDEIKFEPPVFCSFCGRTSKFVNKLVKTEYVVTTYAPSQLCICDECIDVAYEMIHGEDK